MYGLINDAIRQLVISEAGDDAWRRIVDRAGTGQRTFAAMHYYDDAVTYALVRAASEELETPADDLLRAFGRYWSTRIAPESYGDFLASAGGELWQILTGLDAMHGRLQSLFPELRPPSIEARRGDDGVIDVTYRSHREGLAPFVHGLLEGLVELCAVDAAVAHTTTGAGGPTGERFTIATAR